jgi:hypothetical protein
MEISGYGLCFIESCSGQIKTEEQELESGLDISYCGYAKISGAIYRSRWIVLLCVIIQIKFNVFVFIPQNR